MIIIWSKCIHKKKYNNHHMLMICDNLTWRGLCGSVWFLSVPFLFWSPSNQLMIIIQSSCKTRQSYLARVMWQCYSTKPSPVSPREPGGSSSMIVIMVNLSSSSLIHYQYWPSQWTSITMITYKYDHIFIMQLSTWRVALSSLDNEIICKTWIQVPDDEGACKYWN